MKVLKPSNTTHTIVMHPREYPKSAIIMRVTNEYLDTFIDIIPSYVITNGVMYLTFDLDGNEFDKFTIQIIQTNVLIFDTEIEYIIQDGSENEIEDGNGNVIVTDVVKETIYRHQLFFTEQEPQDYKINKDKFIYA